MTHAFDRDDVVRHRPQGPLGRIVVEQRASYTVLHRLPIEADGRIRYRIKSSDGKIERVATEDQLSRLS